jgi:hypothetical protein
MIKNMLTPPVTAVAVATIAPTPAHAALGFLTVGMKLKKSARSI